MQYSTLAIHQLFWDDDETAPFSCCDCMRYFYGFGVVLLQYNLARTRCQCATAHLVLEVVDEVRRLYGVIHPPVRTPNLKDRGTEN